MVVCPTLSGIEIRDGCLLKNLSNTVPVRACPNFAEFSVLFRLVWCPGFPIPRVETSVHLALSYLVSSKCRIISPSRIFLEY